MIASTPRAELPGRPRPTQRAPTRDAPTNGHGVGSLAGQKRLDVYNAVAAIGAVPVFNAADLDDAVEITRACVNGGMRVVEFTNRGDHVHEVFSALQMIIESELPEAILGAGTVLDPATAALYVNSGARLIVGPNTNAEVARLCNRRKVAYIPGCGTASEISYAEELGCEIVKLFPAQASGGPGFVKDLLGPMPWSSIMPTGGIGVERDALREWFAAGVAAVGLGSSLVTRDIVERRAWDELERRSRETVTAIREIRAGL